MVFILLSFLNNWILYPSTTPYVVVFTEVISHPIITFRDVRFLKLTDLGFGSLSIILKQKKCMARETNSTNSSQIAACGPEVRWYH